MLARLANESGGHMTHNTNDLSLGFARAQRDLGCQYTLGFYVSEELEDTPQHVAVHVKRPGLRAMHADKYMFRSESAKREGHLSAAFHVPGVFDTGYVSAHLFTLQPKTKQQWATLVAVSFPVRFDWPGQTVEIDFGGVVRRESVVHSVFNRRVSLREKTGSAEERRFLFLEPMDLEPGSYELTVVMAETSEGARAEALRALLDVPPITRRELMLVQPILGQPRDKNIVVRGDGPSKRRDSAEIALYDIVATKGSFEPLFVQRMRSVEQVLSRNKVCLVNRKQAPEANIGRSIAAEGEEPTIELIMIPVDLEREGKVLCQNVFERLPAEHIDDGAYLFEATVGETRTAPIDQESLRFAVSPPVED